MTNVFLVKAFNGKLRHYLPVGAIARAACQQSCARWRPAPLSAKWCKRCKTVYEREQMDTYAASIADGADVEEATTAAAAVGTGEPPPLTVAAVEKLLASVPDIEVFKDTKYMYLDREFILLTYLPGQGEEGLWLAIPSKGKHPRLVATVPHRPTALWVQLEATGKLRIPTWLKTERAAGKVLVDKGWARWTGPYLTVVV